MAGSSKNYSNMESGVGPWGPVEKHKWLSGSCLARWILHTGAAEVGLGWAKSREVGGKRELQLDSSVQGLY